MTVLRCRAKNPDYCKYHRPNAASQAFLQMKKIENRIEELQSELNTKPDSDREWEITREIFQNRLEHDEAEQTYNATPDGFIALAIKRSEETDPAKQSNLQMLMASARWRMELAEEQNDIDERAGGALIPKGESDYVPPSYVGGGNHLWPTTAGSKYSRTLEMSSVKSKINADLKEAQKAGYLPKHVKFKITSHRGSHRVTMLDVPDEQIYEEPQDATQYYRDMRSDAIELKDRVDTIANAYSWKQYDEIEGRINVSSNLADVKYENSWERDHRIQQEAASRAVALQTKTNKKIREAVTAKASIDTPVVVGGTTADGVQVGTFKDSSIIVLGTGADRKFYDFNSGRRKISNENIISFFSKSNSDVLIDHYSRSELK